MALTLHNVSVKIGKKEIVRNVSLQLNDGQFVGVIGLNGSGKSTLLKAVYGINKYTGQICLNDNDIKILSKKEIAKKIAVLVQENSADFDFKVKDIVLLGRLPYKNLFDEDTCDDYDIVKKSLEYVGMLSYAERYFSSLSGGEKQRVLIARILAQQTDMLILDEPTNYLDIKNQYQFFEMIKSLNLTVLAVLHDLNLAAKFCDYLYVIYDGQVYAEGTPQSVLSKELLREVFSMEVNVHKTSNNKVFIEYLSISPIF